MDSIKNAEKLSFIDTDFYSLQSFSILETGEKHPVVEDFVRHANFDILLCKVLNLLDLSISLHKILDTLV